MAIKLNSVMLKCMRARCRNSVAEQSICKGCQTQIYCSTECRNADFVNHARLCIQNVKSDLLKAGRCLSDEEYKNIETLYINDFEPTILKGRTSTRLGKGSYGEVQLMKHKKKELLFAVKSIEKSTIKGKFVCRFIMNEINVQPRFIHDNIIRMYAALEDSKYHYLIMEYGTRGNLYQIIQQSKGLSEADSFYFFIQACNSLYFLHTNRYIHRDVKPENFVLIEDGTLKLCDFGWLTHFDDESKSRTGTLEYMAPELLNGSVYDYTVDIWSLGVLLYELIHGFSPFVGQNDKITIYNILNRNFTFKRPCSESIKDLINALLKYKPYNRIKWNQIFHHPWVKGFKTQYCERRSSGQVVDSVHMSMEKDSIDVPMSRENKNLHCNKEGEINVIEPPEDIYKEKEHGFLNSAINIDNDISNRFNNTQANLEVSKSSIDISHAAKQSAHEYNVMESNYTTTANAPLRNNIADGATHISPIRIFDKAKPDNNIEFAKPLLQNQNSNQADNTPTETKELSFRTKECNRIEECKELLNDAPKSQANANNSNKFDELSDKEINNATQPALIPSQSMNPSDSSIIERISVNMQNNQNTIESKTLSKSTIFPSQELNPIKNNDKTKNSDDKIQSPNGNLKLNATKEQHINSIRQDKSSRGNAISPTNRDKNQSYIGIGNTDIKTKDRGNKSILSKSQQITKEELRQITYKEVSDKPRYTSNSEIMQQITHNDTILYMRTIIEDFATEYYSISIKEPIFLHTSHKDVLSNALGSLKKKLSLFLIEQQKSPKKDKIVKPPPKKKPDIHKYTPHYKENIEAMLDKLNHFSQNSLKSSAPVESIRMNLIGELP